MANIFETEDPRGYPVYCTSQTWDYHVILGHSEMYGQENEVRRAVESPSQPICQDVDRDNRNVYYRLQKGHPKYMKAIVEFDEHNQGRVVTAFFTDSGKEGEAMIWPQSSD